MTYAELYAQVEQIAANRYFTIGVETTNTGLFKWSKPDARPTVKHEWAIYCEAISVRGATPEAALVSFRNELGKTTKAESASVLRSVDADLIEAFEEALDGPAELPADVACEPIVNDSPDVYCRSCGHLLGIDESERDCEDVDDRSDVANPVGIGA